MPAPIGLGNRLAIDLGLGGHRGGGGDPALPLYRSGVIGRVGFALANLVGAVLVVGPATLAMAWAEARPNHRTIGKRVLGLTVRSTRDQAGFGFTRALGRNSLKIALPWLVGHAAVFALVADGGSGTGALALTAGAYVLPLVYLVAVCAGTGRTPYDRLTRTHVVRSSGSWRPDRPGTPIG